jgi:hypothetical protein
MSLQKNFKLSEGGKRRIQLRVDALNAFNHPVFRVYLNASGGMDVFSAAPSTSVVSTSEYNAWAAANGKPSASTPDGLALMNQSVALSAAQRNSKGVLPLNFYSGPLPANFWGTAANTFDITSYPWCLLFIRALRCLRALKSPVQKCTASIPTRPLPLFSVFLSASLRLCGEKWLCSARAQRTIVSGLAPPCTCPSPTSSG